MFFVGHHHWQADFPVRADDAAVDNAAGQDDNGAGVASSDRHHPVLHSGAAGQLEPKPADATHQPRRRPAGNGRHAATLPLPQTIRRTKSIIPINEKKINFTDNVLL